MPRWGDRRSRERAASAAGLAFGAWRLSILTFYELGGRQGLCVFGGVGGVGAARSPSIENSNNQKKRSVMTRQLHRDFYLLGLLGLSKSGSGLLLAIATRTAKAWKRMGIFSVGLQSEALLLSLGWEPFPLETPLEKKKIRNQKKHWLDSSSCPGRPAPFTPPTPSAPR